MVVQGICQKQSRLYSSACRRGSGRNFDYNMSFWNTIVLYPVNDFGAGNKNISPQLAPSGPYQYKYSSDESEKLKQRGNARDDRNFVTKSPSIAPVLWSLLLVSGGFWLCILGGGVALFGIGSLLGVAGILPWGFWWSLSRRIVYHCEQDRQS